MGYAKLQADAFHLEKVLKELTAPATGAVTFYVGTVRAEDGPSRVDALEYETYPEMAQPVLETIRTEAIRTHGLLDAVLVHRTGRIPAGEPTILVAVAGRHRAETFQAVADIMDRIKQRVPVWKREDAAGRRTWILGTQRARIL